jgi:hypothetical protein
MKSPQCYNLYTQGNKETEYSIDTANVIATIINFSIMHLWMHSNMLHLVNPRKLHLGSLKHLV